MIQKSNSYRDLVVWQEAMNFVAMVYELSATFPKDERFGLVSQVRRAAVSVPSNIAEGQGRSSSGEFLLFLGNAKGSLHEVETQLLVAHRLGFIGEPGLQRANEQLDKVTRLLNGLINSMKQKVKGAALG